MRTGPLASPGNAAPLSEQPVDNHYIIEVIVIHGHDSFVIMTLALAAAGARLACMLLRSCSMVWLPPCQQFCSRSAACRALSIAPVTGKLSASDRRIDTSCSCSAACHALSIAPATAFSVLQTQTHTESWV